MFTSRRPVRQALPLLAVLLTTTGLAACGETSTPAASSGGRALEVSAAFYPLQFAAEQIGGPRVQVTSLTKPGGEPHDLELTPRDVSRLTEAKLVIYESGFQAAVDDAVKGLDGAARLDVAEAAKLSIPLTDDSEHDHGESSPEASGHGQDPHFWLDPIRYAAVGEVIADRLAQADPANASLYRDNAAAFTGRLHALDQKYVAGLASCKIKDIATGHAAFAYLAARYGLHQEAITISPDQEPTPAQMRDVTDHIREHGITTVYSETLVSPAVADTVAREAGAKVAVLDPIEGITTASAGRDYFQVMESNLATLVKGQDC